MEDLQLDGLKLIQKKKGFRFGLDAVVLADFAKLPKHAVAADLCSGSGIVALLLCHHYRPKRVDAVELQEAYADLARRNVWLNGVENVIAVYHKDAKQAADFLPKGTYDAVVCNPPYKKAHSGLRSPAEDIALAREEIAVSIEDIACVSSKLLKFGGKLYLVHRPERLDDIFAALSAAGLAIKRLRFIANRAGSPPSLVLIEAALHGKLGLKVEPQLIVYEEDGGESAETKRIYRRREIFGGKYDHRKTCFIPCRHANRQPRRHDATRSGAFE